MSVSADGTSCPRCLTRCRAETLSSDTSVILRLRLQPGLARTTRSDSVDGLQTQVKVRVAGFLKLVEVVTRRPEVVYQSVPTGHVS